MNRKDINKKTSSRTARFYLKVGREYLELLKNTSNNYPEIYPYIISEYFMKVLSKRFDRTPNHIRTIVALATLNLEKYEVLAKKLDYDK